MPLGTAVEVSTDAGKVSESATDLPSDVVDAIEQYVPTRYREAVKTYLQRCVTELNCTVEMPDSDRRFEYVNVYPPPRCRRSRVSAVTYPSGRTAVFTGPIDLDGFKLAEKTMNGDTYAYPKLPHLDSSQAIDEAIELAKRAIKRLER